MKRAMDVIIGLTAVIALAVPLCLLAFFVRLKLGSPVLFYQQRPGLNGRPFYLVKFRTMTDKRDPQGNYLPDSERLTKFGKFLRSTSLDELPELYNVLKGEMSLVGPRPLLMEYLERYSPEQARRHDVKPGITGWAQIHGRNTIDWEERFKLDVWYVDNQSTLLDLKILLHTVGTVIRREGSGALGDATTPYFMGQKKITKDGEKHD